MATATAQASSSAAPVLKGQVGPYKELASTGFSEEKELKGTGKFAAASFPESVSSLLSADIWH